MSAGAPFNAQFILEQWQEKLSGGGVFRSSYPDGWTFRACDSGPWQLRYNHEQASTKRRPPSEMAQPAARLVRAFDPDGFHFGKARPAELLAWLDDDLQMHGRDCPAEGAADGGGARHAVLLNVSPLARGHFLLVPRCGRLQPQVLTLDALRLAFRLARRCRGADELLFRAMFNSLSAHASVNHLHFHGLFVPEPLPVETFPRQLLLGSRRCDAFTVPDFPVRLLVLSEAADGAEGGELAGVLWAVVEALHSGSVPFNLMIADEGRTAYLFPRQPQVDMDGGALKVAVAEVCGVLVCRTRALFDALTESRFRRHVADEVSLPEPAFEAVCDALRRALRQQRATEASSADVGR